VLKRDITAYWMPRLKRGMTIEERGFAISPRMRASFALTFYPQRSEGAGNAGRSMRPQPRVQCVGSTRV
jgi:hypothetical protein